jgi:hypothetical protein
MLVLPCLRGGFSPALRGLLQGRSNLLSGGHVSQLACIICNLFIPRQRGRLLRRYAPRKPAGMVGFAWPFFRAEAISFPGSRLNRLLSTYVRTNVREGDCFVAMLLAKSWLLKARGVDCFVAMLLANRGCSRPEREIA